MEVKGQLHASAALSPRSQPLYRRLGGPQSLPGCYRKKGFEVLTPVVMFWGRTDDNANRILQKNLLAPSRIEPTLLGRPARPTTGKKRLIHSAHQTRMQWLQQLADAENFGQPDESHFHLQCSGKSIEQ
jgi:hypothetical protein